MFNTLIGFAIGVVAGPTFTHKVWPRLVAWWKARKLSDQSTADL